MFDWVKKWFKVGNDAYNSPSWNWQTVGFGGPTVKGQPPSQAELESAADFLRRQGQEYGLSGQQFEHDPRVWTDLCHVLMNVKEFVFLN